MDSQRPDNINEMKRVMRMLARTERILEAGATLDEAISQLKLSRKEFEAYYDQYVVGWLYRVVRNEAITQSRSQSRRTRHEATAGSIRQAWFNPTDDDTLDAAAAVTALQSLPPDEREVIVLRLWSGLSFEEIAELIGKSTSTAHRWYESGLSSLRQNWCPPCPIQKTNG
jgi:RNA polymerase sigma factor (sigma-70 family)